MYMHFLQKNIDLFNLKKSKESEQNSGWVDETAFKSIAHKNKKVGF